MASFKTAQVIASFVRTCIPAIRVYVRNTQPARFTELIFHHYPLFLKRRFLTLS